MKISKEKLKQIIKEELREADMRGMTDYENPDFPSSEPTAAPEHVDNSSALADVLGSLRTIQNELEEGVAMGEGLSLEGAKYLSLELDKEIDRLSTLVGEDHGQA